MPRPHLPTLYTLVPSLVGAAVWPLSVARWPSRDLRQPASSHASSPCRVLPSSAVRERRVFGECEAVGGAALEVFVGVEVLAGGVEVGSIDRSGFVMCRGCWILCRVGLEYCAQNLGLHARKIWGLGPRIFRGGVGPGDCVFGGPTCLLCTLSLARLVCLPFGWLAFEFHLDQFQGLVA